MIKYGVWGVLNKEKRLYTVVKSNVFQNHFIAIPLTDIYIDKNKKIKKIT